jgi:hypothetical protein
MGYNFTKWMFEKKLQEKKIYYQILEIVGTVNIKTYLHIFKHIYTQLKFTKNSNIWNHLSKLCIGKKNIQVYI